MVPPRGVARRPPEAELLQRGTTDLYADPEIYDFEFADRSRTTGDAEHYVRLLGAAPGRDVAELGAGTGRITLDLLASGARVLAVDRMAAMLEKLKARARTRGHDAQLRTALADLRHVPAERASFDLVLAPFNTLMHLYTHRDLRAAFAEARRLLRPGGLFAFDVELPDPDWLSWDSNLRHSITPFRHPKTGEAMVYSTNHTYDPATQICHIRIYYDRPRRGRRTIDPRRPPRTPAALFHLAHRQIYPEEIRLLADVAGFSVRAHDGDFEGGPLRTGAVSQVVVLQKP